MNILVTGAGGFTGRHLVKLLTETSNNKVFGVSSQQSSDLLTANLMDYAETLQVIKRVRPDVIFHLAAYRSPAQSFYEPAKALAETLTLQINLFESCLEARLKPKILVVGSGQVYGKAAAKLLPLKETAPIDLTSPYTVAKFGQESLANYYRNRGLQSIVARPFNHMGPGQHTGFIVSDFAKQIAELELAGGGTILVGNLEAKRDFTDVRDIVRAYVLLADKGSDGEVYNICQGRSSSGQEILDGLLAHTKIKITAKTDPERMRPSDIPDIYGDYSKLKSISGWAPAIPLVDTLKDVLDDWRERVKEK